MDLTRRFLVNSLSCQRLTNLNKVQPLNYILNACPNPVLDVYEVLHENEEIDRQKKAQAAGIEYTQPVRGKMTYYSHLSASGSWQDLEKTQLNLAKFNPQHKFTLAYPLVRNSWIFGVGQNTINLYNDSTPLQNFKEKMENISKKSSSILRLDHINTSQSLKRQHGHTSKWTYGEGPQGNGIICTAFVYMEYQDGVWNLHIQDAHRSDFSSPKHPDIKYFYIPQKVDGRFYSVV